MSNRIKNSKKRKQIQNQEEITGSSMINEWINIDDLFESIKKILPGPPPTPLDAQQLFECLKNLLPKDNVEIPRSIELSSSYASTTTSGTAHYIQSSQYHPNTLPSPSTMVSTTNNTTLQQQKQLLSSPNSGSCSTSAIITLQSAFTPYNNHSSHTINPTPVTTSK